MLVLSRKENQRILFPNLGIAIQVVRMAGNVVRLGIEAPQDVDVLREEIAEKRGVPTRVSEQARQDRHAVRNRLNSVNLALNLVQKQLELGRLTAAEPVLARAIEELSRLDALISGETHDRTAPKENSTGGPVRKALLVEDNDHERELLAAYLRLHGYQVDTASDGVEAMEYLATNGAPDVVLLDMQMPRLDGPGTITAIRCHPRLRGIKVLAVSAADPAAMQPTACDRGVDRWFSKPLNPPAFLHMLECELAHG